MTSIPASTLIRTEVVCTKCQKTTTVPFTPTPGRPVYCRECFANAPRAAPQGGGRGGGSFDRTPFVPRVALPSKKRMMAQGRKTHFLYDAKAIIAAAPGGMETRDNRAFLESLFAKGARGSTEDAQVYLEAKFNDGGVTHEQAVELGRLIDKYSFYR